MELRCHCFDRVRGFAVATIDSLVHAIACQAFNKGRTSDLMTLETTCATLLAEFKKYLRLWQEPAGAGQTLPAPIMSSSLGYHERGLRNGFLEEP